MLKVSVLRAGTNGYVTTADDIARLVYFAISAGIAQVGAITANGAQSTGDFAVQAQGSPDRTVKVKLGKALIKGTPTGGSETLFGVVLDADYDLAIAQNTSGSTVYEKVYVKLDADTLLNPPSTGDFTAAASVLSERHTASGEALNATNAIELAEITLANGYATITDALISDSRVFAGALAQDKIVEHRNLDTDAVETDNIKDANVTMAKLEANGQKGFIMFETSVETGFPTTHTIYFPFPVTITQMRTFVTKALAATDNATFQLKNNAGTNMTDGLITLVASTALANEANCQPSANNTIAAGEKAQLVVAKTTAGGAVRVFLEYTRT